MTRMLLFWAGIALLAVACLSSDLRAVFTVGSILSVTVFALAGLIVVAPRYSPMALLLAGGIYSLAWGASRLKERAVGLPITWVDIASAVSDPAIIARAVGYHGSMPAIAAVALIIAFVSLALLVRRGLIRPARMALAVVEATALVAVAMPALRLTGHDLHANASKLFPDIALGLWEPQGQRRLARRIGPLEYIAFTYAAGQEELVAFTDFAAPDLPASEISATTSRYLRLSDKGPLPNIVILHAESTFDPNHIFRLSKLVRSPLWDSNPQTVSLGPLRVNVIGGGTQVTQFELFTGSDTRQFGYFGFYSHLTLAPRIHTALPAELARRGYRTVASYPADPSWLGAGAAFKAYGFAKTYFAKDLNLRGDWSESDTELVGRTLSQGVLEPAKSPTFLYLSTLKNHGPHPCVNFKEAAEFVTTFEGSATFVQNCELNEYVARADFTAKAMLSILARLKDLESQTGRPFVFLVYGDHQPWSFTDGNYSVAGGVANANDMGSFSRFRRGNNQNITFFHFMSSDAGVAIGRFGDAIPATLLPTLLSAYAARDEGDLYLPMNLLAFEKCGSDYRTVSCSLSDAVDRWSRSWLFTSHAAER